MSNLFAKLTTKFDADATNFNSVQSGVINRLTNVGTTAEKSGQRAQSAMDKLKTGVKALDSLLLTSNKTFDSYLNTFKSTFASRLAGVWAILRYIRQANQAVANASNSLKALYRLTGSQQQANDGLVLAVQLADKYKIAIEDATEAMIEFTRQGRSMAESVYILDKLAKYQTLMVSATGDSVPMTDMVAYYTSLTRQLKLTTTQGLAMMELISELDVKTPSTFEKITKALQKFASTANISNLKMEEMVTLATGLTSAGFTGEEAGTALNTMLARAFGNDNIKKLFEELNITAIEKLEDGTTRYRSKLEMLLETYSKIRNEQNQLKVEEFATKAFGTRMASKGIAALESWYEANKVAMDTINNKTNEFKDKQEDMLQELLNSYSRLNTEIQNTFNANFITKDSLQTVNTLQNLLIAMISPMITFTKTLASLPLYLAGFGDIQKGIKIVFTLLSAYASLKVLDFFKALNNFLLMKFADTLANTADNFKSLMGAMGKGADPTGLKNLQRIEDNLSSYSKQKAQGEWDIVRIQQEQLLVTKNIQAQKGKAIASALEQLGVEKQITSEKVKQAGVNLTKTAPITGTTSNTATSQLKLEQEAVKNATANAVKEAVMYNVQIKATASDVKCLNTQLGRLLKDQDAIGKSFAIIYGYTDAIYNSLNKQVSSIKLINADLATQLTLLRQISSTQAASHVQSKVASTPSTGGAVNLAKADPINVVTSTAQLDAFTRSAQQAGSTLNTLNATGSTAFQNIATSAETATTTMTTSTDAHARQVQALQKRLGELQAVIGGTRDRYHELGSTLIDLERKGLNTPALKNAKVAWEALGPSINDVSTSLGTMQIKNDKATRAMIKNMNLLVTNTQASMEELSKAVGIAEKSITGLGGQVRTVAMKFANAFNIMFQAFAMFHMLRMVDSALKGIKERLQSISDIKFGDTMASVGQIVQNTDTITSKIKTNIDNVTGALATLSNSVDTQLDTLGNQLKLGEVVEVGGIQLKITDISEIRSIANDTLQNIKDQMQDAIDKGKPVDLSKLITSSIPATDTPHLQEAIYNIFDNFIKTDNGNFNSILNSASENITTAIAEKEKLTTDSLEKFATSFKQEGEKVETIITNTIKALNTQIQKLQENKQTNDIIGRGTSINIGIDKDIKLLDEYKNKLTKALNTISTLKTEHPKDYIKFLDKETVDNLNNIVDLLEKGDKNIGLSFLKNIETKDLKTRIKNINELTDALEKLEASQKEDTNIKLQASSIELVTAEDYEKQIDKLITDINNYFELEISKYKNEAFEINPKIAVNPLLDVTVQELTLAQKEEVIQAIKAQINKLQSNTTLTDNERIDLLVKLNTKLEQAKTDLNDTQTTINKAVYQGELKNSEDLLKLWREMLQEQEQLLEIEYKQNNQSIDTITYKQELLKIYKKQHSQLQLLNVSYDKINDKNKLLRENLLQILQLEKDITDTVLERERAKLDRQVNQLQFTLSDQEDYMPQMSRVEALNNVITLTDEKLKLVNEELSKYKEAEAPTQLLDQAQSLNQELVTLKQNLADIQYRYNNLDLSLKLSTEIDNTVNKLKTDISQGIIKGVSGMESVMQTLTTQVDNLYTKIQEVINNTTLSSGEKDTQIQTLTSAADNLTSQLATMINNMSQDTTGMTALTSRDLSSLVSPWASAIDSVKAELEALQGKTDETSLKYKEVLANKLKAYQDADQAFLEQMREQQEAFLEDLKSAWDEGFDIGYEYGFTEEGIKQLKKHLARKIAKQVSDAIRDSLIEAFNKIDTSGIQKTMSGLFGNTFGTMFTKMIFGIFSTLLGFLIGGLFNDLFESMEEAQREQQKDQISKGGYDWSYKDPQETKAYNQYAPNITQESVKIVKFMNNFTITVDAANAMIAQRSAMEKVANEIVEKNNRAIAKQIGVRI